MKKLKYEKPVLDVKLVLLEQVIASSVEQNFTSVQEEGWMEEIIETEDITMYPSRIE